MIVKEPEKNQDFCIVSTIFVISIYHISVKNTPYYTVQAWLITAEPSDKQDKITNMTDYQTSNRKTRPLTDEATSIPTVWRDEPS